MSLICARHQPRTRLHRAREPLLGLLTAEGGSHASWTHAHPGSGVVA